MHFNSHARVGRDAWVAKTAKKTLNFNSHARVGRDQGGMTYENQQKYFNSHARVGRDYETQVIQAAYDISTHTPA